MKQVIAKTTEISHEEWLKLRLKGIGGSDCAAAVGMSRWKSPLEVFMEKTGRKAQVEETEKMYWGRTLEPVQAKSSHAVQASKRKQCRT